MIVNAHDLLLEQPAPRQPANVDPAAGVAVSVSVVPVGSVSEHVPGQLIPEPLTLPDPLPPNAMVRDLVG